MLQIISRSLWLLLFFVVICCVIYPAALWVVGQTLFPDKANGSMVKGPDGALVGSLLIAQPFTKDEYFQPRPSACSYDGSASSSSALAASNYALRGRVAATLGPIVTYQGGPKDGKPVAPDIEAWFQKDQYQGAPSIVAQWADAHNGLAQAWVGTTFDPKNPTPQQQYVLDWEKTHAAIVAKFKQDNPTITEPAPSDLAVVFFESVLQGESRPVSLVGHGQRTRRQAGHEDPAGQRRLGHSIELLRHVAAGASGHRASGCPRRPRDDFRLRA